VADDAGADIGPAGWVCGRVGEVGAGRVFDAFAEAIDDAGTGIGDAAEVIVGGTEPVGSRVSGVIAEVGE
jgi:hypothetical protein